MEPQFFQINGIPAALWGGPSEYGIVAVHGAQSGKTDIPFRLLAAANPGCQILSFDLPEHGERKEEPLPCKVSICVEELSAVLDYAASRWSRLGLFAVSLGAYLGLLACRDRPLCRAWFLSPVTDLERLTRDIMDRFQISPDRLKREQTVSTPMGQTLYWDDYSDICCHAIDRWPFPTDILRGAGDTLVAAETVAGFAQRFGCRLEVAEGAGHWFHTPEDLAALSAWFQKTAFVR